MLLVDQQPDTDIKLLEKDTVVLARWMAGRYNRAALPDVLVSRLQDVIDTFQKVSKKYPFAILGLYLDYDPPFEISSEEEPYELRIAIVYSSRVDGASEAAHEAEETIRARFERKYKTVSTPNAGMQWRLIELSHCEAVADTSFSLRDALDYKLYHLEHMSLRQTPIAESPTTI